MKTEIKKISETEYLVGENSYTIIENIIYVTIIGDQNKELTLNHERLAYELAEKVGGGEVKFFINLNKIGKNSFDTRLIVKNINFNTRINKIALFGLNPVAKVIASFFIGFKKDNKMRFFNSKDKALAWLRE